MKNNKNVRGTRITVDFLESPKPGIYYTKAYQGSFATIENFANEISHRTGMTVCAIAFDTAEIPADYPEEEVL